MNGTLWPNTAIDVQVASTCNCTESHLQVDGLQVPGQGWLRHLIERRLSLTRQVRDAGNLSR